MFEELPDLVASPFLQSAAVAIAYIVGIVKKVVSALSFITGITKVEE
ncbi:MAG: hypothetical protein J1E34_06075 [Oscillospiraceae bacterium]|nr:hypothetical protein [Oscillospiraceae bacterium]